MKKILFILIIFLTLSIKSFAEINSSSSASPQPISITPTIKVEDKQIEDFKEKVATKVAELMKQKNNKAISGFILEAGGNLIKIETKEAINYDVRVDQTPTKYFQINGQEKKEIKLEDFKKGQYIIISGLVNDKKIDANFIYLDESFLVSSGKIIEVNKEDYYLKVATAEKDDYVLDIENYTKKQMLNIKTLELETAGFSKIKEGDTIHFVIKKTIEPAKNNRYSAQKFLIIPQEYFIK